MWHRQQKATLRFGWQRPMSGDGSEHAIYIVVECMEMIATLRMDEVKEIYLDYVLQYLKEKVSEEHYYKKWKEGSKSLRFSSTLLASG